MSIAVLTQVYDETRRLAIAGSNLASGDFRLKKLVPPLEASAAKAPVFGKVAEAINKLVESDAKTSADALLELSTLVSAVLYTQGETGAAGELAPIETSDFGLPSSNASARVLKPLIEALTTTGSGREEIIKDAHQRGAFQDLRLVRLAVKGIDDVYAPIAEYLSQHVLPMYGKAIYDDLGENFNPKGKGGQVRRLKLMHKLDAARTHELVEQSLEGGSPDMKVAAIECLEGREESISYLLEQAKAKSGEVRQAALRALSQFTSDDVIETLVKALSGADLPKVADAASKNRSPKLLAYLLEEGQKLLGELFTLKDKEKLNKAAKRFYELLGCFATRDDQESLAFIASAFEQREALGTLKSEVDGQQINRRLATLLIDSQQKPLRKLLVDAHATLAPEVLPAAIFAALATRKPKEVFDLFSPHYLVKVDKKKKNDPLLEKQQAVRQLIMSVADLARQNAIGQRRYYGYYGFGYGYGQDRLNVEELKDVELDPRWLDAAIAAGDTELVQQLAQPKHKKTQEFLATTLQEMLSKKGDLDYQAWNVLETIIRVEHPQAEALFLSALDKVAGKKQAYYSYWLVRLIPSLPKSAAPKIEALLPNMDEKLIDALAPYLAELQAKAG